MSVRAATEDDLEALLPLLRGYCEFYETPPEQAPDDGLLEMSRALIAAPDDEGMLFVATDGDRDGGGEVVGFAACGWKWSSLKAARVVIMEDLFVSPDARRGGHGLALIEACADRARELGAATLEWVTATDNERAQAAYAKAGGTGEAFLNYELPL